jgi:hypothetical protein
LKSRPFFWLTVVSSPLSTAKEKRIKTALTNYESEIPTFEPPLWVLLAFSDSKY